MNRWITVDLDKLAHNYRLVRQYLPQGVKLLAVVKADAYGHGLVEVAKLFAQCGADYLGVTEIEEGLALRAAGITTPVLVFGPFLPEELATLVAADLTATISSMSMLEALAAQKLPFKAHLKLETGLGRTGLKSAELAQAVMCLAANEQIALEGVYTHFATAMWSDEHFVQAQLANFETGLGILHAAGYTQLLRHAANSAALMKYPQSHFDMVRAGTILYGQDGAAYQSQLGEALQDAWSLKVKVTALQQLPAKHGVGYERTFVTKRPTVVAIVPIGYSHGLGVEPVMRTKKVGDLLKVSVKNVLRYLDHPRMRVYAKGNGRKLPVIGKIGMQLTMLDATDAPELKVGDTLELSARRTNVSGLLPKVFLQGGQESNRN